MTTFATNFALALLFYLSIWGWQKGPTGAALASQRPQEVTVTSFNIAWYGLNGTPRNEFGSETRQTAIRQFMSENRLWSDVLVFVEVVDVTNLLREIVSNQYACVSYENRDPKHQHVVLCAKSPLQVSKAPDDDDFILADVALGNKRPAVHALVSTQTGQPIAHVFAVHLKASPANAATRLYQTALIGAYLQNSDPHLPLLLVGDFNTYGDESANMLRTYSRYGIDFIDVELDGPYSYRTEDFAGQYDRFLVRGLHAADRAKVSGPCNSDDGALISAYNLAVSDHCPITVKLWTRPQG